MQDTPVALLIDDDGNYVGVILDGSVYRLQTQTKVVRASDGAQINPATEDGKLTNIDSTLTSIKNTDGIKKITDQLPSGTNEIGKIAQGTKAAGSGAWPIVIYDASGNPASITNDSGTYRVTTATKITDALPTGDNRIGRVKITDDTNVLGIDGQNHAYVSGKSAVGIAPSTNPVSISGVDGSGLKRIPRTDANGILQDNIAQWIGSTAPSVGQKAMSASIPVVLASDQTTLPIQTTGILEMVSADKIYSTALQANTGNSGVDTPMLYLRNPIGSGKSLYLWKIQAGTSVANVAVIFKCFSNPTITANGTALTITDRRIGGSGTSVALAYRLPTASSNGTVFSALTQGQNTNALIFAEDFSIRIDPGNSIIVTGNPSSNNREVVITGIWLEQ